MICPNCGKELPDGIVFCTACGTRLATDTPQANPTQDVRTVSTQAPDTSNTYAAPQSPYAYAPAAPAYTQFDLLKAKASSPLFLAICIVMTVVAALAVLEITIDLFATLGCIACWIIYANAKAADQPLKQGGYKFAAVITRIIFVVTWVLIGLLGLLEVAFAFLASFAGGAAGGELAELLEEIFQEMEIISPGILDDFPLQEGAAVVATWIIIAVIIFLGIAIALMIVYNLCFFRHFDKYTHSVSNAFVTGELTVYKKSVATRLLVFAILTAVFSASSVIGTLAIAPISCLRQAGGIALPFLFFVLLNSAKNTDR